MIALRGALCAAAISLLCRGIAFAETAAPAASPAPAVQTSGYTEAGASHESLSNGRGDWDSQYLRIVKRDSDRQTVYGELESVDRYGMHDDAILIGAYAPLGPQWLANVEGSTSNTHWILPATSVSAGVQYSSGSHWFEGISLRNTVYDAGTVNSAAFTLEHYWRAYRFNYALNVARLAGTGAQTESTLEVDRYYGTYNGYIGVVYVTGREVDNFGVPLLAVSRVNAWSVNGRHWMNDEWALAYGIGSVRQGTLYTRTGGHFGLDYRF